LLSQFSEFLESEFSNFQIFRIFGDDFVLLNNAHQEIDITTINNLPLLKENNLYCKHMHLDLPDPAINTYTDLQTDAYSL
jgi:hypothetical protein